MIICRRPDPLDNQLQEAGGEGGEEIKAHGRTDQSKVVEEVLVDLKILGAYEGASISKWCEKWVQTGENFSGRVHRWQKLVYGGTQTGKVVERHRPSLLR